MGGPDLSNYVEVSERIAAFRAEHPEGCLQAKVELWPTPDLPFVAVRAYAYRSPGDERPGTGWAWEPVPGKTPYTKDSELQNAETSAWGRAIVAVLAADTRRGIASANEVRVRQNDRTAGASNPPTSGITPSSGLIVGKGQAPAGTGEGLKGAALADTSKGGGPRPKGVQPAPTGVPRDDPKVMEGPYAGTPFSKCSPFHLRSVEATHGPTYRRALALAWADHLLGQGTLS